MAKSPARKSTKTKTRPYDVAEYLSTPADMAPGLWATSLEPKECRKSPRTPDSAGKACIGR
jgi:hypothetical protein